VINISVLQTLKLVILWISGCLDQLSGCPRVVFLGTRGRFISDLVTSRMLSLLAVNGGFQRTTVCAGRYRSHDEGGMGYD